MSTTAAAQQALRDLLPRLYAAYGSGDATDWTDHLGDDMLGIGTDPEEWWDGSAHFAEVVAAQAQEMSAAGARLTGGEPRIAGHGDTAWAADRPTLHLADGTSIPVRVTVLAVLDGTRLRIRLAHFSVPVANEELLGQKLTT
jgi:ketosteroid isomerase-like protein